MYKTICVTPPTTEPITLEEACSQLRIDVGFDDDQVELLISASRDKAERYCNRYFTEQTVKIVYEGPFNPEKICLPFPDLDSVESITYIDSSNTVQTIDSSDYDFLADEQVIYPFSTFPADAKSYTVEVVTAAPNEFKSVKIAILMILTDMYETRTESVICSTLSNNPVVENMLYAYRVGLGV